MEELTIKAIETSNLTKKFGELIAVNKLSLSVDTGEIYGFVGLNGAGKTTTIRLLLGMIKPTGGRVHLFSKNINAPFNLWNDVGYIVETPSAYPNLSVRENLQIFVYLRKLSKKKSIDATIDLLKLKNYQNIKAKHLSSGNLQRLALAKALIHKPKLLLLDEPANGLDPAGIIEIREMLKRLAKNGITIFLSSHILAELAKICTKIGIIHQGNLIKELKKDELEKQRIKKLIVINDRPNKTFQLLRKNNISSRINQKDEIEIGNTDAIDHPSHICEWLVKENLTPKAFYVFEEELESFFIRLIKDKENQ